MFDYLLVIQAVVQAELRLRNETFNASQNVEGITIWTPNIIDRALAAVRKALSPQGRSAAASQRDRAVAQHPVLAK